MESLYEEAWCQGLILEADLPFDTVVLGTNSGLAERDQGEHSIWVVASQDCDLDKAEINNFSPIIELRPVFREDPPLDWGIRSAQFLLTETEYVSSTSPRPMVSPALMTTLKMNGCVLRDIAQERHVAFTTWLGLRYNRPAVPPQLLPLAKRISEVVAERRHRTLGQRVRDLLIEFDETSDPPRFSLIAVLLNSADEQDVRAWLAQIAQAIPTQLGVSDRIEAAPATQISLQLVESSFAADVTQLTWRRPVPEKDRQDAATENGTSSGVGNRRRHGSLSSHIWDAIRRLISRLFR